ncbi:MAG: carboxypeptidase regulatory-like domain-containing protein [Bacteroidales bacterium]|nr:carboxypeptidase regulatory-like domain-containing protein [Bacteroidales bacterium]
MKMEGQRKMPIFPINNDRSTTTNEEGYFEVNGLTSGTYIMKVEKSCLIPHSVV